MANKKITELTDLPSPAGADILAIVDDVANAATTKKVTVSNLMTQAPVQTADIANFGPAFYSTVSETTTARTLSNSDNGKVIVCTNASTITVTIPNSLTAGFSCKLVQGGAGLVNVAAAPGTTLSLIGGKNFTSNQYQVVDLINYGTELYVLDSIGLQSDPQSWSGNTYSLSFDGTNDYVSYTQTTFSDGARTFSAWVKHSNTSSVTYPILGGTLDRWGINPSNGFMYLGDTSAVHYGNVGAASTGVWYHYAVTQSTAGGAITFYRNASSVTATKAGAGAGDLVFNSQGRHGSIYMAAKIDEIAIWNSDQAGNISNIYNSGSAADLSTLTPIHWWRNGDFEGGSGSSVNDQGQNGSLDGTINGATFDGTDAP